MARRKPMDMKGLKKSFQGDLDLEEYKRSPNRYTQGGERQSDAYPSAARPASPQRSAAPKARPAAKTPPRSAPRGGPVPPLPPRRPRGPEGVPIPLGPPGSVNEPPIPFQIPQYDPLGNPTGPMSPPAPGSSTQGWRAPPQPTDMIPPMTGPGSDRAIPGGQPNIGQSLQPGQSAASSLMSAIGLGGAPAAAGGQPASVAPADMAGGAIPLPGGAPTGSAPSFAGMAPPPNVPPPMAGPQADRNLPPPGLLDSLNNYWQGMKRGAMGG